MFLTDIEAAQKIGKPLYSDDESTTRRRVGKLIKKANIPYTRVDGIRYIEPQYIYDIKEAMQCRSNPSKGKTRRIGGSEERIKANTSINPRDYLIPVKAVNQNR